MPNTPGDMVQNRIGQDDAKYFSDEASLKRFLQKKFPEVDNFQIQVVITAKSSSLCSTDGSSDGRMLIIDGSSWRPRR